MLARRLGSWRVPRDWLCAGRRWWCGEAAGSWPPPPRAGEGSGLGAGSQAAGARRGLETPISLRPGLRSCWGAPRESRRHPRALRCPFGLAACLHRFLPALLPRTAPGAPLATCPGPRPLDGWSEGARWAPVMGWMEPKRGPGDARQIGAWGGRQPGWRGWLSGALPLASLALRWCLASSHPSASSDPALLALQDSRVFSDHSLLAGALGARSAHLPGGPSHRSAFAFLWFPSAYTALGIFKSGNVCCSIVLVSGASGMLVSGPFPPVSFLRVLILMLETDNAPNKCTISAHCSVSWFQNSQLSVTFTHKPVTYPRLLCFRGSPSLTHATGRHASACFLSGPHSF